MCRLGREFYDRDDVVAFARSLLGKKLCTRIDGKMTAGMIVETEAYRAPDDKACHAYLNKRTARTEPLFQQGGTSYVYLCYGIHNLFNVVSAPEGIAHATLVRAVQPIEGLETMLERRNMHDPESRLTAGPGSASKALGISRSVNAVDMTQANSPVWIEPFEQVTDRYILSSPRVGIDYAGECAAWPWRFRIKGNDWCSPAK